MARGIRTILALLVAVAVLPAQDAAAGDPRERKRAARAAARQGAEGIPALAALIKDPVLEVRIEAVKALVEVGTIASLDPLVEATRDNDPEVQIRAVDGLVNFYLPGYVRTGLSATLRRVGNTVRGRFADTNDQVIEPYVEVRPSVIEALGRLVRGGASIESRANAARAAGILRGAGAVPDLLEGLRSKDSSIMYECLIALQKIRDPEAGRHITYLVRDLDERVQVAAIETVGLLGNLEALPELKRVLSQTTSRRVRRAALTAIAMLPDPSNRTLLRNFLRDRDSELREAAAEGLGRISDPEDLPVLTEAYSRESNSSARLSAAFALVMLGKRELTEFSPLQYLINTLNSAARVSEARALLTEAARNADVRRLLHAALAKATRDEKKGLAQVLAASGDQESIPYLESLTKDPDPSVATEAIRALRSLRARLP